MLHLVNKFLYKRHVDKYGCVGIFCEKNKISSLHLAKSKNGLICNELTELVVDDIKNYENEFKKIIEKYVCGTVPICIGISQEECSYDVMQVSSLPDNEKAHHNFIRWRYEKLFDKKINPNNFSYVPIDLMQGKSCVAVSVGFELLEKVILGCLNSRVDVQLLSPVVLAYPKFIEQYFNVDINYSIILRVNKSGWCLSFVGDSEVIFCRQHVWLKDMDLALNYLIQDIKRLDYYFCDVFGKENEFPVFIMVDSDVFFNVEHFQRDLQKNILVCRSDDCFSHIVVAGEGAINVDALAVAMNGIDLYE